jgi:hypothetical protein
MALRERAARGGHGVEQQSRGVQRDREGRVAAGGFAQQVEVLPDAAFGVVARQVLEIDGNLGAGDVQPGVLALGTRRRPGLR